MGNQRSSSLLTVTSVSAQIFGILDQATFVRDYDRANDPRFIRLMKFNPRDKIALMMPFMFLDQDKKNMAYVFRSPMLAAIIYLLYIISQRNKLMICRSCGLFFLVHRP